MEALSSRTDPYARRAVIGLIVIATLVRLRFALATELGNDEVYYWAYAAFPDWSHFDHPPMVGWAIQLFTLNLALDSEVFIRLAAVASAAIATWLMYLIGRRIGGERAGLFAAILHTSAVYGSVLAGVVILPDAPLVVFWLLSLWLLLEALPVETIRPREGRLVLLAGATIGLAILSKYQGLFLGFGAVLYVLLYDRRWLRQPVLYGSMVLAALIASPILIWNLKNDFISFTYQSSRVAPGMSLRLDYFGTEIGGQILYQNPLTWFLVAAAVFAIARGAQVVDRTDLRILLLNALPLWIVFTGFSLFRSTLPHWTGPAYLPLIALAGVYWAGRFGGAEKRGFAAVPFRLNAAMVLLVVMLAAVTVAIRFIPQGYGREEPETRRGERDPTMDMFGMDQVRVGVEAILARDVSAGSMSADAALMSYRWFPAAHLDYYVATPLGRRLLAAGPLDAVHKYWWINQRREPLEVGDDAYYVAVSNWYSDPDDSFGRLFESIEPPDTIRVEREGAHVKNAFVYRLRGYNGDPLVIGVPAE
ncbi:MAG: glycosyltransferase family 39 protein [Gemmatimonadetes bacterium]|nr:glycosyltransferase family 39 protein [Gemmatimonadota bacterium]